MSENVAIIMYAVVFYQKIRNNTYTVMACLDNAPPNALPIYF